MANFETHPVGTGSRIEELEAKLVEHELLWQAYDGDLYQACVDANEARIDADERLAKAMDALGETRIVLAEHEPHPLPVLEKVLATIAALKGQDDE